MPLESKQEEVSLEKGSIEGEFEEQFGRLLEEINIDGRADILTNEDKFSLIIRKTNNLIKFAGNKFVYYLKTSNNNKLSYISIDDYSQEAKIMLWGIIEANPDKPLVEILKIFKTGLWRITICYFRKSRLHKNTGYEVDISDIFKGDYDLGYQDRMDKVIFDLGELSRDVKDAAASMVEGIDREDLKENFYRYVAINLSEEDARIFNMIARPEPDFIKYCYSCCYSKKKKHKNVISQSNIASYLNVSVCYVHGRIRKLTEAFLDFKEEYGR